MTPPCSRHAGAQGAGAAGAASGRRILLTRAAEDCRAWARELKQRGAEPIILPCITTVPIDQPAVRAAVERAAEESDWLVFTSRRGVEAFVQLSAGVRPAPSVRIAVVGDATGAAAEQAFGRVDLNGAAQPDLPQPGTAAALARAFERDVDCSAHPRVTLALAENAGDLLERALRAAGARCTRLDLYRTVPAAAGSPKRLLSSLGADAILLASPSAVTGFVNQVEIDAPANVYVIGPSTAQRARELGVAVTCEAREPSLEGLLEAMQWRN